jgi:hypothetical protein
MPKKTKVVPIEVPSIAAIRTRKLFSGRSLIKEIDPTDPKVVAIDLRAGSIASLGPYLKHWHSIPHAEVAEALQNLLIRQLPRSDGVAHIVRPTMAGAGGSRLRFAPQQICRPQSRLPA